LSNIAALYVYNKESYVEIGRDIYIIVRINNLNVNN